MISKKICMIGDFSVGKTSLIRRFVDRQFSDKYLSTVGVKISRKAVEVTGEKGEQKDLQMLIWDIEGQTKFKAIAPSYLLGAKGAIIVADVSREETIESLPEHVKLFLSVNKKGFMIIALNKADLIDAEKMEKILQANRFAEQEQVLGIFPTSAKTGDNVDKMFTDLATEMMG
ncbi:MAG: Rab family GTPase [Hormoscilla sp.]